MSMFSNKFTSTPSLKRATHLTFNVIRVLEKNVLNFCLHKFLIKCPVPLGNRLQYSGQNIMEIKYPL